MSDIRRRALTTFALNRTPGLHFPGNFLGVTFAEISAARASVRLRPGEYCEEPDGQVHPGVVALLADVALASVVRANLNPAQRLATVSLQLQFSGAPITGPLEARGEFTGFLHGAAGQQGLSRCTLIANEQAVLFGSGAFMVLNPPPGVTMHAPVSARSQCRKPTAGIRAHQCGTRHSHANRRHLGEPGTSAQFSAALLGHRSTTARARCAVRGGKRSASRQSRGAYARRITGRDRNQYRECRVTPGLEGLRNYGLLY